MGPRRACATARQAAADDKSRAMPHVKSWNGTKRLIGAPVCVVRRGRGEVESCSLLDAHVFTKWKTGSPRTRVNENSLTRQIDKSMLAVEFAMHDTSPRIRRRSLDCLQIHHWYRCNQLHVHCHVAASQMRTGEMSRIVVEDRAELQIGTLDLTGTAPELNPPSCFLVHAAPALRVRVNDRCNFTIIKGEIAASLPTPCCSEESVDRQRGDGILESSIRALIRLSEFEYFEGMGRLAFSLICNPRGRPALPPPHDRHSRRTSFGERFGIRAPPVY